MFKTISRPPYDEFSFSLFSELISVLTCDFEAYYVWTCPPDDFKKFLTRTRFSKTTVILGIKDLLDMWKDYDFWQDSSQAGIRLLDETAGQYPELNFVIFTSLENINLELIASPNILFIPWGGDIVNQADAYQNLKPVVDKNFDSKKTFISLNRNRRAHRLVLLSYLFGQGYDQSGKISYLGQQIDVQKFDNLLDCIPWQFEPRHDHARAAMLEGYTKFYNNKDLLVDDYVIYDESTNNNTSNFERRLRSHYRDSFVELVTESSFCPPSFMLTEKTLNSIYGCNFPILFSGVGAVDHLRGIGFDMFDDIVDHNYDLIANPFDRIIAAIDSNQRLLLDSDHVKQLWLANRHRFDQNINCAQTAMYNWYRNRTVTKFNNIRWS
jgi:hypothetical protein